MAARLLAALVFAHSAAALLEGFVDVLVNVNVDYEVGAGIFGDVFDKTRGGDDGYDGCVTVNDRMSTCSYAGAFKPTAALDQADDCLCCIGTTAIAEAYSSCADYAHIVLPTSAEFHQCGLLYSPGSAVRC